MFIKNCSSKNMLIENCKSRIMLWWLFTVLYQYWRRNTLHSDFAPQLEQNILAPLLPQCFVASSGKIFLRLLRHCVSARLLAQNILAHPPSRYFGASTGAKYSCALKILFIKNCSLIILFIKNCSFMRCTIYSAQVKYSFHR